MCQQVKGRLHIQYCLHTIACGAHKLRHRCHGIHIFPLQGGQLQPLDAPLWHSFCLADEFHRVGAGEENCWSGQDAKQKLFTFKTTMTDAASFLSLFRSPQLLPSITNRIREQNDSSFSSSSSSCFPLLSVETFSTLR